MKYYVLTEVYDETNVSISDIPENLERKYEFLEGKSRRKDWPEDVIFSFSNYSPEGMNLTDYVSNSLSLMIISNRFKEMLEEFGAEGMEYLPAKIKNHKGRIASDNYWLVNFLHLRESVDRKLSEFEEDAADKNLIFSFDKLAIRKDVSTSKEVIYRMKEQPTTVLARQDLVEQIEKEGLTGMKFVETEKFKS